MAILIVPDDVDGARLDVWLSRAAPEHSRSCYQQWIRDGAVLLNDAVPKPRALVRPGDRVAVTPPPVQPVALQAEAMPLDVLFEDAAMLVLNKPAGLVVHPAAGHERGTLVNALLHHCEDLTGIGGERRPGIVHRLDKDTSGVMVVAKSEAAMAALTRQFKQRQVRKEYVALVRGRVEPPCGTVETLIGRHPTDRKKMSTRAARGRQAVSHYETVEAFGDEASCLRVRIETGRTHQIRVHMAHLGHAVLGDAVYGRTRQLADGTPVARQLLHAARLSLAHPVSGAPLEFDAPLPADMQAVIQQLRRTHAA
jgi:23S rRNA pseudouridine1911/1915/1917 synthase